MVADSTGHTQHQQPTTDTKPGSLSWLIWLLLLLPLLYVLSVGPVVRHYGHARPPKPFYSIYAPVGIVAKAVPAFQKFLDWYVDLWLPSPPQVIAPPITN